MGVWTDGRVEKGRTSGGRGEERGAGARRAGGEAEGPRPGRGGEAARVEVVEEEAAEREGREGARDGEGEGERERVGGHPAQRIPALSCAEREVEQVAAAGSPACPAPDRGRGGEGTCRAGRGHSGAARWRRPGEGELGARQLARMLGWVWLVGLLRASRKVDDAPSGRGEANPLVSVVRPGGVVTRCL